MRLTQRILMISLAALGWFAIITQLILMLNNRATPVGETLIRFFSFFTILTNTGVALYFTMQCLPGQFSMNRFFNRPGVQTALTVYIFMVGMVYQVALRHIWNPIGMQRVVDEFLHTLIPLLVLWYWFRHDDLRKAKWSWLPLFLLYPLVYLAYVLVRGSASGFYPYYFIHVDDLGWPIVIRHILILIGCFIVVSAGFIGYGRYVAGRRTGR